MKSIYQFIVHELMIFKFELQYSDIFK
jgi:hypothetical protein